MVKPLKFMKTYGVLDVLDKREDTPKDYVGYYLSVDVWDVHVLRIMEGDYEGNDDVFTFEHEKISKERIAERMVEEGILNERMVRRVDIRQVLELLDGRQTINTIIDLDLESLENWDFKVFDTEEEAKEIATQGEGVIQIQDKKRPAGEGDPWINTIN